jgi:asparagine synthase (glutamine-hydrolysing)
VAVEAFRDWPFLDIHYYVRGEEGIFTDLEAFFAATDDGAGAAYVRCGLYAIGAAAGARLVMDGHGGDYTLNVRPRTMLGRILRRGHVLRFLREFRARRRATGRPRRELWGYEVVPALLPLWVRAGVQAVRRGFTPLWRTRPVRDAFARSLFAAGLIDRRRLRQGAAPPNRWRERWLHLLRRVIAAPPAPATLAASRGLEFTRPFHDRRVIELALAIPESLQFKHGLERHLARRVLGDRLPKRLLECAPGNDAEDPDLFRMARDTLPEALRAARDLDRDGRLSRYVDFDRVAAALEGVREPRLADHARLDVATRAVALARFIAWFEGRNR